MAFFAAVFAGDLLTGLAATLFLAVAFMVVLAGFFVEVLGFSGVFFIANVGFTEMDDNEILTRNRFLDKSAFPE